MLDKFEKIFIETNNEWGYVVLPNNVDENIPLVLHGSSGISHNLRKKIARNTKVAKFNIGTELRMIAGESLKDNIKKNKKTFDRLQLIKPTVKNITKATIKVIKNIGPKK